MQGQRELKQQYLRENILEKEYDAQEFMDFCENLKGSVDIDSWTLAELTEIVQKFIASSKGSDPFALPTHSQQQIDFDWDQAFSKPLQKEQQKVNLNLIDLDFLQSMGMSPSPPKVATKSIVSEKKIVTDPNSILAKLNEKNNEYISAFNAGVLGKKESSKGEKEQGQQQHEQLISTANINATQAVYTPSVKESVLVDETFKASLKCRSFSNKPKLDGDYQVVVNGHEIINPNPFVPNYVLYSITTNPINREVKRRLKDFQTLRTLLKKLFPSTQIPFLERCGRLSETEPNVIKKQKLFLESFLNSLMMNKNIRCKIIDDFLLEENLDTLKKNFRDFEKLEKPKAIEDLYTPSGRIELEFSNLNKKYVSQQELYIDYLQPNLGKMKELYDQLLLSFANSIKILGDISQLYDSIRASTRNVNNLLAEPLKSCQVEDSLQKVSDLHKHWALALKTQAKLLEVEVRHLFRYQFDNIQTLREVCRTSSSLAEAYGKRGDREQAGREQYEYNKKLSEFKTGVETVSSWIARVLKHQSAYFLNNSVAEIRRFLDELSRKLRNRFRTFSVLQLNVAHDLDQHWQQFELFAQ